MIFNNLMAVAWSQDQEEAKEQRVRVPPAILNLKRNQP